jgi:hypothetical protein
MDINTFRRVITAFADGPTDIDVSKGTLIVQIRDDLIEARLSNRSGSLIVTESGDEFLAERWIIQRVARLPLLADRILANVPSEQRFVTPGGSLLDQLDKSPLDEEQPIENAEQCVLQILDRQPAGVASVLYLTSDAGEGKTTLISQLARQQAQVYKVKKNWLLVPISLLGRTFMRLDDVVVGALVNRLRFPMLYYDAFIELVKIGAVIPALDGFEEMFVEGSAGDGISALGTLVNTMQSSGTVLIAARKAYFEYKSLHAQTRLFDSLGSNSVAFARLALRRWDHPRFIEYAEKSCVPNAEVIYREIAAKLGEDHPLLTRAVLVKRVLEVATSVNDRTDLLQRMESDPNDYFRQFVGTIIGREARERWIDRKGELAQPLIAENEHYELLASVALEMWTSGTEALRGEVLDFIAEVFAESKRKDKVVSGQIVERLKQHALLVRGAGVQFGFDHEEFYHFFLGEAIGRMLKDVDKAALRHAFRQAMVPGLSADVASRYAIRNGVTLATNVRFINEICAGEPRTSFVKENCAGILARMIDFAPTEHVTVRQGSFPPQSLAGRKCEDVDFEDCFFQNTSLAGTRLRRCRFVRCEFEGLVLAPDTKVEEVALHDCQVRSVTQANSEAAAFAPRMVTVMLEQAHFVITFTEARPVEQPQLADERLTLVERMLRAFMRSTGVNENTLQRRLGAQYALFVRDVLPPLRDCGALLEEDYRGGGSQRRYRLAMSLERIARAIEECNGSFEGFIAMLRNDS